MSWLNIFRQSVPKVGELEPDKALGIRKVPKGSYITECVIYFKDEPVRRVKFSIPAYSRKHAEEQIKNELKIQVARTFKSK